MGKICILTTAHSPFDDRIYYREAVTLKKLGYDLSIIAPYEKPMVTKEDINILNVPKFPNRFYRFSKTGFNIYQLAMKQNADIYHFHDPDLLPWMFLLQKKGKKVIYDVHEYNSKSIITKYWIPKKLRNSISNFVDIIEKKFSSKFSGIITVNPHMAELFRLVNMNTVSVGNYPLNWFIEKCSTIKKFNLNNISYIGGLNKDRGYEVIISTMKFLERNGIDLMCSITGQIDYMGIDDNFPRLKLGINENNIRWNGVVNFLEIPGYLSQSGIFWLPWINTPNNELGTPIKIFEYMAAGRPIVASSLSFVKKIIQEVGCGTLVIPNDTESNAKAILDLVMNPEIATEMGKRGRKSVEEKYNWSSQEIILKNFYESILN